MHLANGTKSALAALSMFSFSAQTLPAIDPPPSDALRLNVSRLSVDLELVGFPPEGTVWVVQGSNDLENWRDISIVKSNREIDLQDTNYELLVFADSTGFSAPNMKVREFFRVVAKSAE